MADTTYLWDCLGAIYTPLPFPTDIDCNHKMLFHITFGREPYPTSNHDDPRFSDDGSSSEVEADDGSLVCAHCKTPWPFEDIIIAAAEWADAEAEAAAECAAEAQAEYRADRTAYADEMDNQARGRRGN